MGQEAEGAEIEMHSPAAALWPCKDPGHFRLSCLQNQQAEKGVILLAWLVEMTIKRRLGCYYTNEDKEEHGNTGDPKATLPVGKSNEGRTTNGPDSSEMKVRSPQQP